MNRVFLILWLSVLTCFGQAGFTFRDLAFMGEAPAATGNTNCTSGTNEVTWTPTNSVVTIIRGNGIESESIYVWDVQTNYICDIFKLKMNDVMYTNFNVNTLTNLRYFESTGSDGGSNWAFNLSGLLALTNAGIYYHTNLRSIYIVGCSNLWDCNFSQNELLTDIVISNTGFSTFTNLIANDCDSLSPTSMEELATALKDMAVAGNISNGTINFENCPQVTKTAEITLLYLSNSYNWTVTYTPPGFGFAPDNRTMTWWDSSDTVHRTNLLGFASMDQSQIYAISNDVELTGALWNQNKLTNAYKIIFANIGGWGGSADFADMNALTNLDVSGNSLEGLDITGSSNLFYLNASVNPDLITITGADSCKWKNVYINGIAINNGDLETLLVAVTNRAPYPSGSLSVYDRQNVDCQCVTTNSRLILSYLGVLSWTTNYEHVPAPDITIGGSSGSGIAFWTWTDGAEYCDPTDMQIQCSSDGGDPWSTPESVAVDDGVEQETDMTAECGTDTIFVRFRILDNSCSEWSPWTGNLEIPGA